MIYVYKVQHLGKAYEGMEGVRVKCLKTKMVDNTTIPSADWYSGWNCQTAQKNAIQRTMNEDASKLEFVCAMGDRTYVYAIQRD